MVELAVCEGRQKKQGRLFWPLEVGRCREPQVLHEPQIIKRDINGLIDSTAILRHLPVHIKHTVANFFVFDNITSSTFNISVFFLQYGNVKLLLTFFNSDQTFRLFLQL